MQDFLQAWATGNGAGRPATGGAAADVVTPGTSAFDELALVYTGDIKWPRCGQCLPDDAGPLRRRERVRRVLTRPA